MADKRKLDDEEIYESDPVVSLQDIIEEDRELETTANAVLGGSNDQDCTYPDGYMVRQALYACVTCQTTEDAGVCLACSLECHDGHELFELYTKRNFRCDCGNDKFPGLKCRLFPNKDAVNDKNNYNHNFKGSYCTCKRPYPDPDDSIDDEMIQCIICEDWFHSRHLLGKGVPEGSDFAEMICHLCMAARTPFLWYYNWEYTPYQSAVVNILETKDINEKEITSLKKEADAEFTNTNRTNNNNKDNNESTNGKPSDQDIIKSEPEQSLTKSVLSTVRSTAESAASEGHASESLSTEQYATKNDESESTAAEQSVTKSDSPTEKPASFSDTGVIPNKDVIVDKTDSVKANECSQSDDKKTVIVKTDPHNEKLNIQKDFNTKVTSKITCKLDHLKEIYKSCEFPDSASFWSDDWREKLCVCKKCKSSHMDNLMYLTNISDTVADYERKGEAVHADSTMDQGMRALGGMNRIQQVEVIQGYNDMKAKLSEYLRTFAQEGKIVTEEDIRHFFQRMSESKKPRLNISHTCK